MKELKRELVSEVDDYIRANFKNCKVKCYINGNNQTFSVKIKDVQIFHLVIFKSFEYDYIKISNEEYSIVEQYDQINSIEDINISIFKKIIDEFIVIIYDRICHLFENIQKANLGFFKSFLSILIIPLEYETEIYELINNLLTNNPSYIQYINFDILDSEFKEK